MKNILFFCVINLISIHASATSTWVYGEVKLVESFSNKIVIRWSTINSQECTVDDAYFSEVTVGGENQLQRAFSLAMAATASGKPLRLLVDGCEDGKQRAIAAQLCANQDCSY